MLGKRAVLIYLNQCWVNFLNEGPFVTKYLGAAILPLYFVLYDDQDTN